MHLGGMALFVAKAFLVLLEIMSKLATLLISPSVCIAIVDCVV